MEFLRRRWSPLGSPVDGPRYGAMTMNATTTSSAALIMEHAHEAVSPRRVMECVSEEKMSWRPHPKSMSLGQFAHHIAVMPLAIAELVSELVREVPDVPRPEA